jgi:hypothetical protein
VLLRVAHNVPSVTNVSFVVVFVSYSFENHDVVTFHVVFVWVVYLSWVLSFLLFLFSFFDDSLDN